MKKVIFQDSTIRDGMQQTNIRKDIVTKKIILEKISKINISSVEIGMCTVFDELKLIESYIKILRNDQEAVVLTRMLKSDIDLVASLQNKFKNIVLKLLVPISDLHIEMKLGTNRNDFLNQLKSIFNYIIEKNINFEICLEDATRANLEYLFVVLDLCHFYGAKFVTIADTVGYSTPTSYGKLIKNIADQKYVFQISAHCHNDLGLGTANTLSAIENGASRIETTFLGIGERAGNVPIDEIVTILNKKKICHCPIKIKDIFEYSNSIKTCLGVNISPLKPLLGDNFFIHESGIHQDGTMKDENMYQIITLVLLKFY